MKVELHPEWSEFLRVLTSHRVRFLLVGAHAVAAHAEARLTQDLDVLVEPTLANAHRLRSALVAFGFGAVAPPATQLARHRKVFMLGRKPWRIDLLTSISGVSFARAWRNRVPLAIEGGRIHVLGRTELLINKRRAGRAKDLADIEALSAAPKHPSKRRR